MPQQDETGEKTEEATPRQRERAREEGRVANSREVGTLFVLTTATLVIYFFGSFMTGRMARLFAWILQNLSSIDLSAGGESLLLQTVFLQVIWTIGPLMLGLMVASIAGTVIQTGFLFSAKPLQPQGNRINPIEGAQRVFSWRLLMETFKSIFKLLVVAVVSYYTIRRFLPQAAAMVDSDPVQLIPIVLRLGLKVALYMLLFLLIVALSDYAFQRWEYEKSIRMSRYEVKQELKETRRPADPVPCPLDSSTTDPSTDDGSNSRGRGRHHQSDPLRHRPSI